ncbi:MAG TPA: hypothetical protein ENH41_02375 [Candidatus Omnitrophica bacterium]|nr:hypothetical protein [Candidatus Omnitrophota bacterium]
MALIIIDRTIMFFLGLMIFFLPISKAVIEISASICIFAWIIKKIIIFKRDNSQNFIDRMKDFFRETSRLNIFLILFIFANLLSVIFSSNFGLSINAFIAKLMEYILIFLIVRDTVNSRLRYRIIISVLLSSLMFVSFDGFFQKIAGYDLFRHRELFMGRVTASFINPNDLGSYLVTLIPLALGLSLIKKNLKLRLCAVIVSIAALAILVFTLSKGAGCAFLAALVFFGFYTKKRYVLAIFVSLFIIALILTLFFNFSYSVLVGRIFSFASDAGVADRKLLWAAAVRMFLHSPIFGVGLGTFMKNYPNFWIQATPAISYTHNCYLQTLAETGIVGLSAFMLFLFSWLKRTCKVLSRRGNTFYQLSFMGLTTGIVAYLLNSFVDTNFYSLPIAVLFWYLLGLQQAAMNLIKNND